MIRPAASRLVGYGCVTAAGQGASALYESLQSGRDHSRVADTSGWPRTPGTPARVYVIADAATDASSALERMARQLRSAWEEALGGLAPALGRPTDWRLGVIFASTKGCVEDYVWTAGAAARRLDSLTPVLARFLALTALTPVRTLCLSNACTSTHVALQLGALWLQQDVVSHVLVLAADHVGPFVVNGFASLRSLALDRVTPFGVDRQGIQLGEAAAALLLAGGASDGAGSGEIQIQAVETCVEGFAVTRSNESGTTLARCCATVAAGVPPDVIVAHGTGTVANDAMEDGVYDRMFGRATPITGTKWAIGHCLGASGAVDVIASAEALRRQALFVLANTAVVDPALHACYLAASNAAAPRSFRRVLVASAGFGGIHGAAMMGRL